jgi:hypothetical protein
MRNFCVYYLARYENFSHLGDGTHDQRDGSDNSNTIHQINFVEKHDA